MYFPKALLSKCLLLVVGVIFIKFMSLSLNFVLAMLAKKDNHDIRCLSHVSFSEFYGLLQSCGITLEGGLRKLPLHQRVL